ncbi:uridine kinase family protein [Gordonia sp. CPCC 205333]|uniref:uridine kinase family protein n=1 Tax=Gordonia sp. CPCC 205333 TaxID=3140790 RepID=UPI003AF3F4D0
MANVDGVAAYLAADVEAGIVAIDGPSGSGKSTFADSLVADLAERGIAAVLIRTDDFATWANPVGWWPELEDDVLHAFSRGRDVEYRPRQWADGVARQGPLVWIRWQPLLIIEGVSSARRQVADRLACALWLDGPSREERLARSVARDGEEDRANLRRWQAFEDGWFAVDETRMRCRVVG